MNSSRDRRRWIPSPAMVVALFAVVLAMGGTATALSGKFSVKRNDIAPRAVSTNQIAPKAISTGKLKRSAVRSNQIADRSIGSYKLRVGGTAATIGESSTTSTTPVDLGGPSVTVKVPAGAMLAIQAEAAIRATGNAQGRVYLTEPTLVPIPSQVLKSGSTQKFQTKYSVPGSGASGAADGVASKVRAGWIVMPSTPGTKTFSLRYDTTTGTAIFKNRRLTVSVIR